MTDYKALRERMVQEQLFLRGISEKRVLAAFLKVERHKFLPQDLRESAYMDFPLSIGAAQTISQPYMVALMTECLELSGRERVLEIGTGSGYQTAILAELAGEVYSVERIDKLADCAQGLLLSQGYRNVRIKKGDGTLGWPEEAPFDRVIVTAGSPSVPSPLLAQLKESGILLLPIGQNSSQMLTLFRKTRKGIESKEICACVFVPLLGQYGWRNSDA